MKNHLVSLLRTAVVIALVALIGATAYFIYAETRINPTTYRLGVASALRTVAYELAGSQVPTVDHREPRSLRQILESLGESKTINYGNATFTLEWNFVDCAAFETGRTDSTIVLFPEFDLTKPPRKRHTPILARVSKPQPGFPDNLVFVVCLNPPDVFELSLADSELAELLACQTPDSAAIWLNLR